MNSGSTANHFNLEVKNYFLISLVLSVAIASPGCATSKPVSQKQIKGGTQLVKRPATKRRLALIENYICYYGPGQIAELSRYDLAILESSRHKPEDIDRLRQAGTKVVGYVSLGEEAVLQKGDESGPGGYASWYFDKDADSKPDRNGSWGSYYVDARSEAWKRHLIHERLKQLVLEKHVDGFFFDTVDTVDLYPESAPAMVGLIKEIRKAYPDKILIMNRGFTVARDVASSLDGIMFEVFSMHRDWNVKERIAYARWSGSDLDWTSQTAQSLRGLQAKYPLQVLALDYCDEMNKDDVTYCQQRAKSFGFIGSVASVYLDKIYRVNLPPRAEPDQHITKERS